MLKSQVDIKKSLRNLQVIALERGIRKCALEQYNYIINFNEERTYKKPSYMFILSFVAISLILVLITSIVHSVLGTRCLIPINYLVWEATRPLADCDYCANITKPIVITNITRKVFQRYAYTSKPIVVKNIIHDWKATKHFNYYMLKKLFEDTKGSYESFDEGCQFLNFKSDLFSMKEVFNMPDERVRNKPGEKPWYVGWANCHSDILAKIRHYYSIPEFLPEDSEFPETENIFFGYEIGAVMHLDYIPRLMWQGQVSGNKNWSIVPVPECEHICQEFKFFVEPGDIVLLDTRVWYHSTSIPKGQFSITVQSEYG